MVNFLNGGKNPEARGGAVNQKSGELRVMLLSHKGDINIGTKQVGR